MKIKLLLLLMVFNAGMLPAGTIEKTYYFNRCTIDQKGDFQLVRFGNTRQAGKPGEPSLPWQPVFLALPPGEAAVSMEIIWDEDTTLPGLFNLFPQQEIRPVSAERSGDFQQNRAVYGMNVPYPEITRGNLMTQYMNGIAVVLSTFTPVRYTPKTGTVRFYRKVTIRIETRPAEASDEALKKLQMNGGRQARIRSLVQNPEALSLYPVKDSPQTGYQYLIITPPAFATKFTQLTGMYNARGIATKIVTTDSLNTYGTGWDLAEKIRNFIIGQYTLYGIDYVLLAGNPPLVPCRGFYCYVQSGGGYSSSNIPADLYFSGLDGNYDAGGNHVYGEISDDPDLLPDIAVARFTVNDTTELRHVIHKTVAYLTNPVLGELNRPLLAGEHLWSGPMTFGGSYLDLLVNDHTDNGYFTHGIPSTTNTIQRLYDSLTPSSSIWQWSASALLASINSGKSMIHHLGHANSTYVMRLYMYQVVNATFPNVNGIIHNYQFLYTQGCDCGAFDTPGGCISARFTTIDNFLAAEICNSRYGWFDEGTTEGPSEHLEREFVSALYNDTTPERHVGTAHMISKIKTAPWISLPGEFEPGAQRWVHYDCNVFGDPALELWTAEPTTFTGSSWTGAVSSDWNNPANWNPAVVPTSLYDITVTPSSNPPALPSGTPATCHDLFIQSGASLQIGAGKTITVYGTATLAP